MVARLLGDRIALRLRAAQAVLGMGKRYGNTRLEAACERALAHGSPHYRTVKTILATCAIAARLALDWAAFYSLGKAPCPSRCS